MKRREFITLLGCVAVSWPARAQQVLPVIGYLHGSGLNAPLVEAFRRGLSETGFFEGRNIAIEYRWAEGQYDRLPGLAADLVARKVAVIVAGSTPAALAAKAATATTPIVFYIATDPVELGLVARLNRPDRNLTGVTNVGAEVGPKRIELLHDLLPAATSFAVLVNPTSPAQAEPLMRDLTLTAGRLGRQLHILQARTGREIDAAFASLPQLGAGGLAIGPDVYFNTRAEQLASLALRYRVPTVYQFREFTDAGGLMSYGTSLTDMSRISGVYTGRILKGEKPADLAVQQANRVELIINMKTAKTLGITVPARILVRADKVIE